MSGISKTYEGLADFILRDQLAFIYNRDLELFLREKEPKSLEIASKLADQFKEVRYTDIVNLTFKANDRSRSRSRSRSPSPSFRRFNYRTHSLTRVHVLFVEIIIILPDFVLIG